MKRLRRVGRLFTGTPEGVIENAAVIWDGERIVWCGRHGEEPRELQDSITEEHDCEGGLVTAGLIDSHTHPVYAGDRMTEAPRPSKPRPDTTCSAPASSKPHDCWRDSARAGTCPESR